MKTLEKKVGAFSIENEDDVASYFKLGELISGLSKELTSWLVKPQYLVPFLQPGRLVSIKHGDKDFGWGAVINFKKQVGTQQNRIFFLPHGRPSRTQCQGRDSKIVVN